MSRFAFGLMLLAVLSVIAGSAAAAETKSVPGNDRLIVKAMPSFNTDSTLGVIMPKPSKF